MARRNAFALMFVFTALAIFGKPATAQVKIQLANQVGSFSTDGRRSVAVSISLQKVTTPAATTLSGAVQLTGNSGQISMSVSAAPVSVAFGKVTINNIAWDAATIVTAPYIHVDLRTGRRTLAWAIAKINLGVAKGQLWLEVHSCDDDSIIDGTKLPDNTIGTVNIISGGTQIRP